MFCPITKTQSMVSYNWAKMSYISSKNCTIILHFFRRKSVGTLTTLLKKKKESYAPEGANKFFPVRARQFFLPERIYGSTINHSGGGAWCKTRKKIRWDGRRKKKSFKGPQKTMFKNYWGQFCQKNKKNKNFVQRITEKEYFVDENRHQAPQMINGRPL